MKLYNKLLLSFLLVPLVIVSAERKHTTTALDQQQKYTEKEAKEAVALAKKENIDEIDTILQNNNNYSNTEKRKIYKLVDIVKKFKKKFIGISEDAREAMYEDFFEQNGVDNPRVQMIIIRDFINPEETSEKSNQNTSQKAAAATSSASPSTGATASSAQPGKYTVKDAQTALDYVNKDAIKNEDFWEDVSKELDKKNIGEPQKENILQLIEIIIKIKENQNKITLKKKLAEAQQELHQSHEEDDDLKIFYPITDANITKIILEGIEKQLKSEKDQDKSADDDFDSKDNTQELQRKLAQLEKEESTARSSIQGNELEAEMAKIRAQLEQELEKELRRNQDSKLNQKPSDQQQGIEEELATLEQQSIDKLFMNKVARNASNWITKLPEGKQVTQDAVRKLLEKDPALEKNLTDAQLLYVNGFLQAMKL